MNLAKRIEYDITNGWGYNPVQTNFTRGDPKTLLFGQPLKKSDIRSSKYAVRAHLAHLKLNSLRSLGTSLFNPLRNLPEETPFQKIDGRYEIFDKKRRRKIRRSFVRKINKYTEIMNSEISSAQSDTRWDPKLNARHLGKILMISTLIHSDDYLHRITGSSSLVNN